jgi:hypothetical protein
MILASGFLIQPWTSYTISIQLSVTSKYEETSKVRLHTRSSQSCHLAASQRSLEIFMPEPWVD